MKAGKISETVLKRSVFKQLHTVHPSVRKGPGVGIDSSVFQIGAGQNLVLSMNPVTLGITEIGTRGVYKALNNIAVMGAEPIGVMASLLLPTCYSENELRDLIHELDKACEETSATVLGGHTEVAARQEVERFFEDNPDFPKLLKNKVLQSMWLLESR